MRKEDFFEVLGELDDDIVKGAETSMKKRFHWKIWGTAAACLCAVLIGVFAAPYRNTGTPGEADIPGSSDADSAEGGYSVADFPTGESGQSVSVDSHKNTNTPGGADVPGNGDTGGAEGETGTYSVAVFPPDESEQDVMDAKVTSLTETEMMQQPLAAYLPKALPDGFHYGRGSHYETAMKDGTRYHMLRIEYITGTIPEQRFTEDGGAIAPDLESIGRQFLLVLWDHAPKPQEEIYAPEDVTRSLLGDGNFLCIQYGDVYVGVSAETAEAETVLEILKGIVF